MHSPTLANDFSFRLTLAFAPFQPLLSCCARCFPSKSRVLRPLRTLCAKHRGYGVPQTFPALRACPFFRRASAFSLVFFCRSFIFIHLQIPPRRASICNVLCFQALTNPFFHNFFVFTSIQNARVSPTSQLFHRRSRPSSPEIFCRSDEDRHPDRAQRRGTFSTRRSSFTPREAEGHSPLSPTRVIVLASKGDLLNVSE